MKKKLLPEIPKGIELPPERTTLRVGDLKDGEAGWMHQNHIFHLPDRKGVVSSTAEVLFLEGKISSSHLSQTVNQGYPTAWIKRNGALLDVVVYWYKSYGGFKFQKINLSQLEDGGKTAFYLSSYKEYIIDKPEGRLLMWKDMPSGGGAPTEKAKTTYKSIMIGAAKS